MANENIQQVKGITGYAALCEAKTHLDVVLADYGLKVGEPVHPLEYEHLKVAQRLVQLLVEANRG